MSQGETRDLQHLVGGSWVAGDGAAGGSINPAFPTHTVARYTTATSQLLDDSVKSARACLKDWDAMGIIARGKILRRAGDILAARSDELALLITSEEGKTLAESRIEVQTSVETLHYHASAARQPDGVTFASSHPDELIRTIRRPVGVVVAITPWNFPLLIPVWKVAPALLWGNSVVWKPSSETPATAAFLARAFVDAGVPDGVLSLLLGPGSLGAEMVAHPEVDAVTFTGSVSVGHAIRDASIPRGAKLQMELGGHNAAIVLPDADLISAADDITSAAMSSAGQKCTATRRIIAVGSAYGDLASLLIDRIGALKVGPGEDPESVVSPVISAAARDQVAAALDQAREEGAEVLAAATIPDGDGFYVAPVLLAGNPKLTISCEEVFGPIVTLMAAADLTEAIAMANETPFGLTASVFTRSDRSARRCVTELAAGLIKVNAPSTGSELHAPFGGLKNSTFAGPREQNIDSAAEFFTVMKTAYLRLAPEATES